MIVNVIQGLNRVDISYIDTDGQISILEKKDVKFWKYKKDVNGDVDTWDGEKAIKITDNVSKFGQYELRQFLFTLTQKEQDLIFAYNIPNVFACDIEVDITKITAPFPEAADSEAPVNLITITSSNLDTVVYALEDEYRSVEKDENWRVGAEEKLHKKIEARIGAHLFSDINDPLLKIPEKELPKDKEDDIKAKKLRFSVLKDLGLSLENPPQIRIYWFPTEYRLLAGFFKGQAKALHSTIWWNNETFDSLYLHNRAIKLEWEMNETSNTNSLAYKVLHPSKQQSSIYKTGRIKSIPKRKHLRAMASPTESVVRSTAILSDAMVAKFGSDKPLNFKPAHRLELDYMVITEKFSRKRDSKSLKLDVISKEFLGVGKVSFDGKFQDLITGDTETFFFYGSIDTITLMLIHLSKLFLNQILISSYSSKVSVSDAFYITRKSAAVFHDYFWNEQGLVTASSFDGYGKEEDEEEDIEDNNDEDAMLMGRKRNVTTKVGYYYTSNVIGEKRRFYKSIQAPSKKIKPFEGGYVVPPRLHKILFGVFLDMKAQYPNSGKALGCSKEILLGVNCNDKELEAAFKAGHRISFNRNVYDGSKDGALKTIWTRQIDGRYHAKDLSQNLLQFYTPAIVQAIKEMEAEGKNK